MLQGCFLSRPQPTTAISRFGGNCTAHSIR